jgi:hypothetical protein
MTLNLHRELVLMQKMMTKELKRKYADLFEEMGNTHNRTWCPENSLPKRHNGRGRASALVADKGFFERLQNVVGRCLFSKDDRQGFAGVFTIVVSP